MRNRRGANASVAFLLGVALGGTPTGAEVVEEIVAWVNGDIVTKSELEQEEQTLLAEVYRRYTGPELDEQVLAVKQQLLDRLIDRKILLQRAGHLYDMNMMEEALLDSFKEQQKITTDAELERLLAQEGLTIDGLKQRLVEIYAPEEVIRFEVANRIGTSDKEIEAEYQSHLEGYRVPAKATLREIVLLADAETKKNERRAEAEGVLRRLSEPDADFAAVASEVSEAGTRENGGLLVGAVGRGDLTPQLDEVAFQMPVGQVSPLIETPYGFHIIRVETRNDAYVRPLDEVREEIRERLAGAKYTEALHEFLEKAREESEIVVKEDYEHLLSRP